MEAIVYCTKCGDRITPEDLKEQFAFKLSNRYWCIKCVYECMPKLSKEGQRRVLELFKSGPTSERAPGEESASQKICPYCGSVLDRGIPAERTPPRGSARVGAEASQSRGTARVPVVEGIPVPPPTAPEPVRSVTDVNRIIRPRRSVLPWVVAGVAVCMALVAFGVALSERGRRRAPRPSGHAKAPTRPPVPDVPVPVVSDGAHRPEPEPAVEPAPGSSIPEVDPILRFYKENPTRLDAVIGRLEEVLWRLPDGSVKADKVKKLLEYFRAKQIARLEPELKEIRGRAEALVEQRRFPDALRFLQAEENRHDLPAWKERIAGIQEDVRKALAEYWRQLRDQAQKAESAGEAAEILAPFLKWEIPPWDGLAREIVRGKRLGKEPGKAKGEEKPKPSPAAKPHPGPEKAYEDLWRMVAESAGQRRYAAAIGLLQARSDGLPEELRTRALRDLRNVRWAEEVFLGAVDYLQTLEVGERIRLPYVDPEGRKRTARGPLRWAGAARVEIGTDDDDAVFVELSEVDAEELVRLYRKGSSKRKEEEAALRMAAFLLFEGRPDDARRLVGAEPPEFPKRYWDWAATRSREKRPRPSRKELERERTVREIFYRGLRAMRDPATVPMAIVDFRDVLEKFSETDFVRQHREEIEDRARNSAREAVVEPHEFSGAGGVWSRRTVPNAPNGTAWVAREDTIEGNFRNNWLDLEYFVESGHVYDIWVLAYVCCRERARFFVQGTGLTSRGGEAEVGGRIALEVRPGNQPGLEQTHVHRRGLHRWRWLKLVGGMRVGTSGKRKLRLMTESGDLAVSHVVVTSLRSRMPEGTAALRRWAARR